MTGSGKDSALTANGKGLVGNSVYARLNPGFRPTKDVIFRGSCIPSTAQLVARTCSCKPATTALTCWLELTERYIPPNQWSEQGRGDGETGRWRLAGEPWE
jgi:hypothetical protein